MIRKIIKIDKEKCNGCGLCVDACHEGAIGLADGVATLLRDDYCDGLGDCLPVCPEDAIHFEEREAAAYDEAAVQAKMEAERVQPKTLACGCPGTSSRKIEHHTKAAGENHHAAPVQSRLNQWPVQIKLAPPKAPYFDNADLLIAADCTAYAYGDFHNEFIKNRITLIGCPKLDDVDYAGKLTDILANNNIRSLTVVRMEVPCCGGIVNAVKTALKDSGKIIPWSVTTVSTDGRILDI
ncbi:4Fe-4S binding protein [Eubacterium sp. 1001713B170207_170306_E7]|uniref:4Fe-4S binding protein n=1 Tax=Eubacterium sp. 1001713B170207_170306_E7 TaxID=2787097 RepID=UPI0018972197|nr:4Fe-4S binding protein [Eubacterium sp. 1001713B170207_170306_E7]